MPQVLYPDSNVTQTNFTGGFADIDEVSASDSDWAYPNTSAGATLEVGLANPASTVPGTGVTLNYRLAQINVSNGDPTGGGAGVTITPTIYEGATLRATGTARTINSATWTSFSDSLTASVSDWNNVRIRFAQTAAGGRGVGISWANLSVGATTTLDLEGATYSYAAGPIPKVLELAGATYSYLAGALTLIEKTFTFGARRSANRSNVRRKSFSSKER